MALAPLNQEGIIRGGRTEWAAERPSLTHAARRAWRALGLDREGLQTVASPGWAIGVPVAAIALMMTGIMLQPAPAEEATGAEAVFEGVVAYAVLGGFAAALMGAFSLRRWGMASALGVSLLMVGLVVSCPVSGHHTFGLWFAGQSACVLAALGIATMGLVKTRG